MNNATWEFEKKLNYEFKDKSLLEMALTHSSYHYVIKENKALHNNERLEFLGDAFLDAIISEELYARLPDVEEGTLTKMRAKIVCEETLAVCGAKIEVGNFLKLGRGEEKSGGRRRESIIADAVEAIIGAMFLDGGYDCAKKFVLSLFGQAVEEALSGKLHTDYKSEMQERVQGSSQKPLKYRVTGTTGPDHDKVFYVDLFLGDEVIGRGRGKSKKEAERNAEKEALERSDKFVF